MAKRGVLLAVLAMLLLAGTAWAVGQTLSVQVREVQLRTAASFSSGLGATLRYGQSVNVLEEQGAWVKVSGGGESGWVHRNALTNKPLNLSAGGQDVAAGVGDKEVSMAGKGFNAQTEQVYRQEHPGGYAQVEAMLKNSYPPDVLYAFLEAGQAVVRQGVTQ